MTSLFRPKLVLLGLAIALTLIQLRLVWEQGVLGDGESYFLGYAAVWFMVWRRHAQIQLSRELAAQATGIFLVASVLSGSLLFPTHDLFLRLAPLISGLGIALLGCKFSQFNQYWRELLVLASLALPTGLIREWFDLSLLTATAVANFLWYLGQPIVQDGTLLITLGGNLEINQGCSGVLLIVRLLNLAFLFVMMFPMRLAQTMILAIAAISIGFVVNLVRVAILICLFAVSNLSAFQDWHVGRASQLFSLIAVLGFSSVCYVLLEWSDSLRQTPQDRQIDP